MPLTRTATTEGAALGIVTVRAPHKLNDNEVVWLQDAVVNQTGLIVRRNGIPAVGTFNKAVVTNAANTARPVAVISTYDPEGTFRIAVLYWDVGTLGTCLWGSIYDASYNFIQRHVFLQPGANPAAPQTFVPGVGGVVYTAPLLDGGVAIYAATDLTASARGSLGVWYGGASPTASGTTGNILINFTGTITQDTLLITTDAAGYTAATPGMIVEGTGVIRRKEGANVLSLLSPMVGGSWVGPGTRNLSICTQVPIYQTVGLVSGAVGGAVSGFGTKFRSAVDSVAGAYNSILFSKQDGTTLALPAYGASTTNTSFTGSSIQRAHTLEAFRLFIGTAATRFVIPTQTPDDLEFYALGGLVTSYAGYQFWANSPIWNGATTGVNMRKFNKTGVVWIGGPGGPFDIDMSPADGSFFNVDSPGEADPDIVAVGACNTAAVFCKRRSTHAITGDNLDNFSLNKIEDDGCLGPNAIAPYNGGVVWCGKKGIWFFDGQNKPKNLIEDTILPTYQSMVASIVAGSTTSDTADAAMPKFPVRAFVYRDHLFVSFSWSFGHNVYNGNAATAQLPATLVMYLPNKACTFWTNFRIHGFLPPSANDPSGYALLVSTTNTYHLVNLDYIMDPENVSGGTRIVDAIQSKTTALTNTPKFYMETRRYDLGDAMNRKVWKGFAMESTFTNATQTAILKLDYVTGLNVAGTSVTATFPDTLGLFKAQRVKFRARDQFLGFRIYEDTANRTSLKLAIAPWQLIYKPGRPGAI